MFDVHAVRAEFPILQETVHGRPLIYLDNAATAQMPKSAIDALNWHYAHDNANVHRGVHELSARSTRAFEQARERVAAFIGAQSPDCVVFTSGTTGSLNALASALSAAGVIRRDVTVLSTLLEHHSNFVPWQQAAHVASAHFEAIGIDADANLDMTALEQRLAKGDVSILACTQMSNITGTVVDIAQVVQVAHAHGVPLVVDAAQSAAHCFIDVRELGCDFLAFSGHKLGSLTGIGVLYVSPEWLDRMPPYQFGGGMVDEVALQSTTFEAMPLRMEAGTPNYVGALSLAAAIEFLNGFDREGAYSYENDLAKRARAQLEAIDGLRVLGNPRNAGPVISFVVEGVAPLDLTTFLDLNGIAVRSGTGCAQPLLEEGFGIRTATRLSLSFINTQEEIDFACEKIAAGIRLLCRS